MSPTGTPRGGGAHGSRSPASPLLPLLVGVGTGGRGGGATARRGLLPYVMLGLAGFLVINLWSWSGTGRNHGGGSGNGSGSNGTFSLGAASDTPPPGAGVPLDKVLQQLGLMGAGADAVAAAGVGEAPAVVCDCSGQPGGAAGKRAVESRPAKAQGRQRGGSKSSSAARPDGDDDGSGGQPPPPWLGAGRAPASVGKRHVRVVIRVHHLQEAATRSLIWALRGQEQPTAAKDRFTVDFALVATERKGLPVVRRLARDMWRAAAESGSSAGSGGGDVFVADTPEPFYELAANRSAPFRCTEQDRERYRSVGGERYVRLHCGYDNHAYYQATDVAVLDAAQRCAWCTHVLVTNSDNAYHPGFLAATLAEGADLVTTNFVDHGDGVMAAEWTWGQVDLGGVLAAKPVVARTGGFIASLPPHAGPQETHDNDYWFVHKAIELGATTAIVRRFLFFHN